MENKNGFWSGFGKFSAVVLVIGGLITIYTQVFPDGSNIEVECISTGYYKLQPNLNDDTEKFLVSLSKDSIIAYIKKHNELDKNSQNILDDVIGYIAMRKELLEWRTIWSLRDYSGYSVFKIKNSGNKPAEDVVLNINTHGIALVEGVDPDADTVRFNKLIKIGELRPEQTVTLYIWSSYHFSRYDGISISDKSGKGSVLFPEILSDIEQYLIMFLPVIIFFLIGIIVSVFFIGNSVGESKFKKGMNTKKRISKPT